MSVMQEDLNSFHRFASEQLHGGGAELSWDELFILWQSSRDRASVNAALRGGLADLEAGRYQPAEEAMEEIRRDFGFPE